MTRRWRVTWTADDAERREMLGRVVRGPCGEFLNPYTDIDWESPEFAAGQRSPADLPATDDLLGQARRGNAVDRDRWRQANGL